MKLSAKHRRYLKSLLPPVALITISLILIFLNYKPDTWFTGWDNLHPEFKPGFNLNRTLNTTWQEYQSLGLLGGMGHAADLIRQLLLLPFYSFIPASFIRYMWAFLMLILGPLGVYFLTKSIFFKNAKFDQKTKIVASFFAGLFYLLNLGTLQAFYAPFEPFITFYAGLPWLLLVAIDYLDKPTRRSLFFLFLTNLFFTPSFYIQTLFVVYIFCLMPILIYYFFVKKRKALLPILLFGLTTLAVHAYWLLPSAYFSLSNSSVTIASNQNHLGTEDIILRNQEYGNLGNVTLLKGFFFDFISLNNSSNEFELMMGPWVDHLDQPAIQLIGYIFFALVIIGLFYSIRRRLPYAGAFTAIFLLSLFFLINLNPPTGFAFQFLQDQIPLLRQFFRSVYTKWSIPASLSFSLFFSVGVIFLLDAFSLLHFSLTTWITSFTLGLMLLLYSGPMFEGHLIYPAMRQDIPDPYFQLFDFFDNQDKNTRIANLPQHTLWGWEFYNWGYRGSGFLWYGIEQPILDRAFDTWSSYSEDYYQEISRAIYAQDPTQLENIIEKYQINWLLLDRSLIVPGSESQSALYLPEIENMIGKSKKITKATDFDFISVYKTNLDTNPTNFFNSQKYSPTPETNRNFNLPTQPNIIETPLSNRSITEEESSNCDPFNSTAFAKTTNPNGITYSATNANLCDHFLYPELPHAYGYEFQITHKNNTGQPFLVCVESYTSNTCLTYTYLDRSTNYTTSTLIIPPMNPTEYGYTLHLYSYSIGREETSNTWNQIEVRPISPLTFALTTPPEPYPYTNPIDTDKRTYSLYTASVDSPQANSLLTLNQAYDSGWKAYTVNPLITRLPNFLLYPISSMLVPLPETSHLEVNDWANGWLLPQGKSHLIIVYKPQLLQYLGFFLFLGLPILFLLHSRYSDED